MRFLWFLLMLASVSLAEDKADYCPLAEGMEWIMDAKVTTPDGKVIDTTAHRTITATEESDGQTYFRMRTSIDGIPELLPFEMLVRKDATALYSIDLRDQKPLEYTAMVLPFTIGSKWTRNHGGTPATLEVLALEDLVINGKTYKDCYKLKAETKDGSYREDLWQAPGLGSIKSDVILGGGAKISVSLREFKPGKK